MRTPARNVRLVKIGLGVVLVAFVAWVVLVIYGPITLPFQAVDASITLTPRVNNHHLQVTGTTDLPDGSPIDWHVQRHQAEFLPEAPGGRVTVASGAFAFDADLSGWTGTARVEATFSCDLGTVQPKATTDRVGEHCEHLVGLQVNADSLGDAKRISSAIDFDLP